MNGLSEELQGNGKLLLKDGTEIGEVAYTIRVYQAGLKRESYPFARFRQRGHLELYDFVGKPVTLVLEDGRRWDCCINSLDGSVVAAGPWPERGAAADSPPPT